MNEYLFEDLAVGIEEHFDVVITEEMFERFYEISCDCNPLHRDKSFAEGQGFPDRVVYGLLTASFISKLGGVYLPGKFCFIQAVEAQFVKPVFVGDTLTVSGTVKAIHESVKQAEIKVIIKNQKGEKVLRGNLKVGFLSE